MLAKGKARAQKSDIDQVLVVDDADRSREKMESGSGKPPLQKKQKPASGGRRLRDDEVYEAVSRENHQKML